MRRADARFILPRHPSTAALLGEVGGWADALAAAGIRGVAAADSPDLVVADGACAADALAVGAPMVLIEGGVPRRRARALDYAVQRYVVLADVDHPEIIVRAHDRRALEEALRFRGGRKSHLRMLQFRLAGRVAAWAPTLVWRRARLTLASREGLVPAALDAARGLGATDTGSWYLVLGSYRAQPDARLSFVTGPGSGPWRWAVKVSRIRHAAGGFDRDAAGAALLDATAPSCASAAPRILGRATIDEHPMSVETAAVGLRLGDVLRRDGAEALPMVEAIARWLIELADASRQTPGWLRATRAELEDALHTWRDHVDLPNLIDVVLDVPAVLTHGDAGSWNIVWGEDGFRVMDWETAELPSLPLGDLVFFLGDACSTMVRRPQHPDQLIALFAGRSDTSELVFRLVAAAADRLDLSARQAGALATLTWLRRAAVAQGRYGDDHHLVRFARRWLADPDLGVQWAAWQRWVSRG